MNRSIYSSDFYMNRLDDAEQLGHDEEKFRVFTIDLDAKQSPASVIPEVRKTLENIVVKDGEQIDLYFLILKFTNYPDDVDWQYFFRYLNGLENCKIYFIYRGHLTSLSFLHIVNYPKIELNISSDTSTIELLRKLNVNFTEI